MLNGHMLNDRYEIRETIGGGGMANVYVARDVILNRDVAIKVLRLEYANDDEFIARFRREAHSATSLSHPNIVNIYDVGEEEHIYYMVMEYVDGMTLKQYIQTYGPLEVEESIEITKQITAAITHAHDNDIIHRDIKPHNILIDEHKQVKVTDFGIAMALSATSLTQTNSVLGSVHYLSPEQARGGMATKKSDIYSIGIVLFEMLSGRLPFSGQSAVSIALKHLQSETPSLKRWNPDIPQSVENVVLKATAKDPLHRYEEVHDMVADLETALHPSRQNEQKFVIPVPDGDDEEVTKAIPVITNDMYKDDTGKDETIIHNTDHSAAIKKTKEKKPVRWKRWLTGLLLLVVVAGIVGLFLLPTLLIPKDVEVMDVKGMEYGEAFSKLSKQSLEVKRETIHSKDVEEGMVIKTNPPAGTTVKEGASITIFSSLGKEKVEFDDYVGQTFSQVKKLLENKGYSSIIKYTQSSNEVPAGDIIRQTEPAPGEKVIPENTTVIFEVSSGPEKITLVDLTGKTRDEMLKLISDKNNISIENTYFEYSDTVPEGEVIRQKPQPYEQVEPGASVEVWISKGMEEKAPQNKVVTFTVEVNENQNQNDNDKEQPEEHKVKIYIGDQNHDYSEVETEETITESKQYNRTLVIPPEGEARYRVVVDGEEIKQEVVPYEEGENE